MLRFGLCCVFRSQPIKFKSTTATSCSKLSRSGRIKNLEEIIEANADALMAALRFCAQQNIGSFRVNSQILPLKTHPELGYNIEELPASTTLIKKFKACGAYASVHNIRTTFHPDQFVVLNSNQDSIVKKSIKEVEYQCEVASWINADVINVHAGGAYGDKSTSLRRLAKNVNQLSEEVRSRLTLENDDRIYTPTDLLPVCQETGIPLVYDVHHHRCNPDQLSIDEATGKALATWKREPLFHISSPKEGWNSAKEFRHHEYIDVKDFPCGWRDLSLTIEVEAKAKELAVMRLMKDLTSG